MQLLKSQKGFSVLFITLSVSILLILIASVLYFFTPLKSIFIKSPPVTHTLVNYDSKKTYELSNGDIISGKGIPETTIKISLVPSKIATTIKITPEGNWSYQLPSDLKNGKYFLTIINFDKANTIVSIKNYKFEVGLKTSLINVTPKVYAIDGGPGSDYDWQRLVGDEWIAWLSEWHKAGICPSIDDSGQIIYSNPEVYGQLYPGYSCNASKNSLGDWQSDLSTDKNFFVDLYLTLALAGYSEDAFINYFPEWKKFLDENRTVRIDSVPKPALKNSIDQDTLVTYINQVATKKGYLEKGLFKQLMNLDPFFGSRAIYNLASGYPLTNTSDYIDASLSLLSFIPELRAGGKASVELLAKNLSKSELSNTSKAVKAIEEGAVLSNGDMAASYTGRTTNTSYGFPPRGVITQGYLPIPNTSISRSDFYSNIYPYMFRHAWPVPTALTTPMAKQLITVFEKVERGTGRPLWISPNVTDALIKGHIYVVDDAVFPGPPTASAYTRGDMIVLRRSYFDASGANTFAKGLIYHELTHLFRADSPLRGFNYAGDRERDKVFTGIYELMTDFIADAALDISGTPGYQFGYFFKTSSYSTTYADLYQTIYTKFFNIDDRIMYDFMEFAITGDADALVTNVVNNPKIAAYFRSRGMENVSDYIKFKLFFRENEHIDFTAISYASGISTSAFVFPAIIINDNFITDDSYKLSSGIEVTVTSVEGEVTPNSSLHVVAVGSLDGEALNNSEYKYTWELQPKSSQGDSLNLVPRVEAKVVGNTKTSLSEVTPLEGGASCEVECDVRLPSDLSLGEYNLVVYLSQKDSDQILAADSYVLNHGTGAANPQQLSCSEDQMEFAGCDQSACGKEFWRCKGTTETASFPNETGDCALKGGPNPACENEGRDGFKSNTDEAFDAEGNRVPFFGLLLGPDQDDSLQKLQGEGQRRIAEMKDYSGSLDYLKTQTSDPEVMRLIDQAQGKVNACYE